MEGDMRSYVVSIVCDPDNLDDYRFINFVTDNPVNSFAFWQDFYRICFDLLDYDDYFNFNILDVEEGFL